MHKKICILDYGLGNVKSLFNALSQIGHTPYLYSSNTSKHFDLIFIPGVGSFSKASEILHSGKYLNFLNILNKDAMIFGICLGMQLFASEGEENGKSSGLNYIAGKTEKLKHSSNNLILPFVGYFDVSFDKRIKYLESFNLSKFYFVHSYKFLPKNNEHILSTTTNQGVTYCSSVINKRFIGTQFHPEKSGDIGLEFLKTIINNNL